MWWSATTATCARSACTTRRAKRSSATTRAGSASTASTRSTRSSATSHRRTFRPSDVIEMERRRARHREATAERAAPFRLALGHELQRLAVEPDGVLLRPPALCLLRGTRQLGDRPLEVPGVAPVMRQRADRLVRRAGRPFEELRHRLVPPRTIRAREELVRDVADEHMGERPLLLVLDERARLSPDQVAPLELLEDVVEVGLGGQGEQCAVPEDLADDGGIQEDRAVAGRQRVEASCDQAADARR